MGKKAVVLLSGGMDSAVVLSMAAERGFEITALTFDYGQKNLFEIECAKKLALRAGVCEHKVLKMPPEAFGVSAVTSGKGLEGASVPETYVPGRNTVFISVALAVAESLGAVAVFYGANSVDFSGYPDCTGEYVEAFNILASKGLARPVRIEAPLLKMSKAEIAGKGRELGVDFSLTSSCYFPGEGGSPCGACASCALRTMALGEQETYEEKPSGTENPG